MIATNELITICLTLVSNFASVLDVPKPEVPRSASELASYVIGSPNSPLDVHVTGRSGACFGMEDGMIYYYYSPRSLFHEQDPGQFQRYAGRSLYTSNTVVLIASNALRRLIKVGNPSMTNGVPRVRQAEAFRGTEMPFFQVQWPKISPQSHVMAADMEIDGRNGSIVSLILFDDVFRNFALAGEIKGRVLKPDGPGGAQPPDQAQRAAEAKPDEPSHEGRLLSEWLASYAENVWINKQKRVADSGFIAVHRIGTNALPSLLKWMDGIEADPKRDKTAQLVSAGFDILRSTAAPALPELRRMLNESTSELTVSLAVCAIGDIEVAGLPTLQATLDDPHGRHRPQVAATIGQLHYLGTNVAPCIPSLARCVLDKDEGLARSAVEALGELCLLPEISVPALTNCLVRSDSPGQRTLALESLAKFGASGRGAVPALIRIHNDKSDPLLQVEAEGALMKIAPENVTNNVHFP